MPRTSGLCFRDLASCSSKLTLVTRGPLRIKELHRRKCIALSHPISERPKEMTNTISVEADQLPTAWKNRISRADFHQDASHVEHSPRPVEHFLDGPFVMDHSGVE